MAKGDTAMNEYGSVLARRVCRLLCLAGFLRLVMSPSGASAEVVLLHPLTNSTEAARVETALLSVTPTGGALRLLALAGDACPTLTVRASDGRWDLSAHRYVEFTLTNSGEATAEFGGAAPAPIR